MCKQGELVWMPELGPHGRYIDKCMEDEIRKMIASGTETIGCCCGHGKYPKTVIYRARSGAAVSYFTSTFLLSKDGSHKKRNFYVMDDEGFYYIPKTFDIDGLGHTNTLQVQESYARHSGP